MKMYKMIEGNDVTVKFFVFFYWRNAMLLCMLNFTSI